jgi:hypothetical protein
MIIPLINPCIQCGATHSDATVHMFIVKAILADMCVECWMNSHCACCGIKIGYDKDNGCMMAMCDPCEVKMQLQLSKEYAQIKRA